MLQEWKFGFTMGSYKSVWKLYKSVWDHIQESYKSARLLNLNPHSCKKPFLTKKDG